MNAVGSGLGATVAGSTIPAKVQASDPSKNNPDQKVVKRAKNYVVIQSEYEGDKKYIKIYTGGKREGEVVKMDNWSDGIGTQSIPEGVVETSEHVTREFSTCCPFFTSNDSLDPEPYNHRQNSFTLRLTEPADVIGKATLTETVSALAGYYLATNVYGFMASIGFGVIVSAAVSLGSGRNYTFSTHDDHYKVPFVCERPRIITGVANEYKAYPNDTVPASAGQEGEHMEDLQYQQLEWDGTVKFPDCRNC